MNELAKKDEAILAHWRRQATTPKGGLCVAPSGGSAGRRPPDLLRWGVPDVSVYRRLKDVNALRDEVKGTEPPLLAVEILSPTQPLDDLVRKAEAYLAAGVGACWLVQPSLQTVTVFRPFH